VPSSRPLEEKLQPLECGRQSVDGVSRRFGDAPDLTLGGPAKAVPAERSFFLIMKIIDSKYRPMLFKAFEIALAQRATQAAALDEPEMARYTLMLVAQDRQLLARLKKPAPFTVNGDGDALAISGVLTAPS
jgi:hypothetical protein